MTTQVWYDSNSHSLSLTGLKDNDGVMIDDAVVTGSLLDDQGVGFPGVVWPVTMVSLNDGSGTYKADLPAAVEIAAGDRGTVHVTAVKDQAQGTWTCKLKGKTRGC